MQNLQNETYEKETNDINAIDLEMERLYDEKVHPLVKEEIKRWKMVR